MEVYLRVARLVGLPRPWKSSIEWESDLDENAFLECIRNATAHTERFKKSLVLGISSAFVKKYMNLDELLADRVDEALVGAPIAILRLDDIELPVNLRSVRITRAHARKTSRWNRLCKILASIPTMRKAYCLIENDLVLVNGSIHGYVVPFLQQITSLALLNEQMDPRREHEVASLVAKLGVNRNLRTMILMVSPDFFATALPAFDCDASMETVVLAGPLAGFKKWNMLSPNAALAISDFLRKDSFLVVKLRGYFTHDDGNSYPILCSGIARSGVSGLSINACYLGDNLTLLGNSILQSRLKSLTLRSIFSDDNLHSLLSALAPRIADMQQLEVFVCKQTWWFSSGYSGVAVMAVALVHGLAQCPRLKVAHFSTTEMTTDLERAVIKLFLTKESALKKLQIECLGMVPGSTPYKCSSLRDIIRANYSTRKITLLTDMPSGARINPWSSDLRRTIDYVQRLNAAGRDYMLADPYNQQKGLALLEATNDCQDCLYLHLRENPFLCQRESSQVVSRKRSSDALETGRRVRSKSF